MTVDVFVLDDGSSDGTSEAIAEQFPEVTVLHGDGELFWSGGMRQAFAAAIAGDYDHYLWLNDDVYLDDSAVGLVLLDTARQLSQRGDVVIVAGLHPGPADRPTRPTGRGPSPPLATPAVRVGGAGRRAAARCDTMNGQVVLIPRGSVAQRIGNIDPAFVQQMGDFDYGLRARAAGCSVWVAPGTLANCAPHPEHRTDQQPVVDEWRRLWSNGELAPGPWAVYSRRWAGRLWPLYWLSPYVRRGFHIVFERTPRRRTLARRR